MPEPAPASQPGYFNDLYAASDDPWGLDERFYERRKRDLLLASLPRPRFARTYEPGCAGGALTVELALRSDHVLAADVAPRAVELARARARHLANVHVVQLHFPREQPTERFDLVVLSEVGYYVDNLALLALSLDDLLTPDGVLVGCHWRHRADDHAHTAEEVHEVLSAGRYVLATHSEADFLLEIWTPDAVSVAEQQRILDPADVSSDRSAGTVRA